MSIRLNSSHKEEVRFMAKRETPLLDQLEGGKWPSFVKDIKQAAEKKPMVEDLLHQLGLSYKVLVKRRVTIQPVESCQ